MRIEPLVVDSGHEFRFVLLCVKNELPYRSWWNVHVRVDPHDTVSVIAFKRRLRDRVSGGRVAKPIRAHIADPFHTVLRRYHHGNTDATCESGIDVPICRASQEQSLTYFVRHRFSKTKDKLTSSLLIHICSKLPFQMLLKSVIVVFPTWTYNF